MFMPAICMPLPSRAISRIPATQPLILPSPPRMETPPSRRPVMTVNSVPVAVAAAFMAGVWLVFSPGEMAFLLYAGAYLALGLAAMALTRLVRR